MVKGNRHVRTLLGKTIRYSALGLALTCVAACSIKGNVPEFEYPEESGKSDQNWPKLAVTEELLAAGTASADKVGDTEEAADRLEARANRLKARGNKLSASAAN